MNIKWMKNSNGKRDFVMTMTFVGFCVVLLKVLFSGSSITVGGFSYDFGSIDSGIIAAILTPTLGAYVARRYTDKKLGANGEFAADPDVVVVDEGQEDK